MRISIRIIAALALTIGFAACGGDDDDGDGNNPAIDAPVTQIDAPVTQIDAPPAATNALGQVCDLAAPNCPAGNTCSAVQGVGSTTMGWCSPMCMNMNTICSTGYTGPAGGTPVCALTEQGQTTPTLCAIICPAGNNAACPTGLTCQAVPNQPQPVSICAP